MEAAIRFSQNSVGQADQRFLSVDVTNRSFKLCQLQEPQSNKVSILSYDIIAESVKAPPFRAFDWHPHPDYEHLVAVGQSSGEATLLSLNKGTEQHLKPVGFAVRNQRPCNAVSISTNHLLAAGLDRVRTDFCLNIWDFSRRMPANAGSATLSPSSKSNPDPLHKFALGETITSLKFFPSSPQHLVAGSKIPSVKLYDLREANSVSNTGLQFNTRCVHNLAIDWADENFFASCSPSGEDASICLWDRRMGSRSSLSSGTYGSRQPEPCLELKNVIDSGSIWSLRFSKSKRGILGVLSSTGSLRVWQMGKDEAVEVHSVSEDNDEEWERQLPQTAFLDRSQDVGRKALAMAESDVDSNIRVISFDFSTRNDKSEQPYLLALLSDGKVVSASSSPVPEPSFFHPASFIMSGGSYIQATTHRVGPHEASVHLEAIRSKAEPLNSRIQASAQSRKDGAPVAGKYSSFDNQSWQADLGFYESTTSIPDLLSINATAMLRCQRGYSASPTMNKTLVGNNTWLQTFWEYVEKAWMFNKSGILVQDNLDLSYLSVYSIWMEDLPPNELSLRNLGPSNHASNARLQKAIEGLVRRLQLPAFRHVSTEYLFHRQLCLYLSGVSWSKDELLEWTKGLVSQGQQSKAAFLAMISADNRLASRCLLDKKGTKDQRNLALAIAGGMRRISKPTSTQEQAYLDSDSDSDEIPTDDDDEPWVSAINNTLSITSEPYARAILTFVKTSSWIAVLQDQTALPLKYRLAIAVRHLDDSALTKYISEVTSKAIEGGDIEGVYLTGIGTARSFHLLEQYVSRFGDLQSATLALCLAIPRYILDSTIRRKFNSWKKQYRAEMMSWGGDFKFNRVAFDIQSSKHAIHNVTGQNLVKPDPPQIRLICTYCNGGLAHHERGLESASQNNSSTTTQDSKTNPLTPAAAAAIGTVCQYCGRGLPRCGVCDHSLGKEDTSFMKWHGKQETSDHETGRGTTERMAGSVGTIVGSEKGKTAQERLNGTAVVDPQPGDSGSNGAEDKALEDLLELKRIHGEDERMARFTVICTKCDHAFHYKHARMWFEGDLESGTRPHQSCPVPECTCFCWQAK